MTTKEIAKKLREASKNSLPIPPIRDYIDNMDTAYKIQHLNIAQKLETEHSRIVGRKIGLTSKSVQKQLGVDQPDFGALLNDMEILNGSTVSMSQLMQPKAETEIAFVLAEDIDVDNITIVELMQCIDFMLPAIEIVGSRIQDWNINILDTIADNASSSHYVLGHTPRTIDEVDVIACKMKMYKNNELVSEGTGASCLGSPLNALLWLANKLVEMGDPLQAGDFVLSGAMGPMVNLNVGDNIRSEIEGFGHVSLSVLE